jgi:hypothetical protein
MGVDRRTLVKGLVAGGALLAWGPARFASAEAPAREPRFTLLLGHPDADAAFERGARSVAERARCGAFEIVRSEAAPMRALRALTDRMARARGTRWIAVLDDGSAAIFQEQVRSMDGRLLARGSHACGQNGHAGLRHEWLAASPVWAAGALLASRSSEQGSSFEIRESFLSADPRASRRPEADNLPTKSEDWIECVGQAVAASAFGLGAGPELGRAHLRVARARERSLPPRRFATFVVEL